MIELTLARAKELLAEAVAERGADYVYTTPDGMVAAPGRVAVCRYVHGDAPLTPGCIVGLVLHKAGVPLEILRQHEHVNAANLMGRLANEDVLGAEPGVATLLAATQAAQDWGAPWGEAQSKGLAELFVYLPRL